MSLYFLKDLLKRTNPLLRSLIPYHTSSIILSDSICISNLTQNPLNYINFKYNNKINRNYLTASSLNYPNRSFSTVTKAVVPETYSDEEIETVESIKLLIDKRIRPVIQQDGGDVFFVSYDPSTGYVYVRLSGACVGCIQSDITLKHMIQGMLCHYLEEITAVYNVDEDNNVIKPDSEND
ncbi:uncharacterized protein TA10900 [Theileria annulata]|uniref:NIF system FeS cluster assembly NifU C-terminal domain-containing protein n=1 Tax=Theileria annulata TaxID=5874 RepID=Q4U974_THEAN|nr:uncharacterized protein TA10900 [Theileria annulata]CAI76629.1 hypothetical protein, conserved [Theileria annulata]|eukprot:XP_953254.1 hypothetical protein, conserved [Theileria annulata]